MKEVIADVKCTIWHRATYYIEDDCPEEDIINGIADGSIEQAHGIYIYDTVEDMLPIDNVGMPTVELCYSVPDAEPFYTNEMDIQLEELIEKLDEVSKLLKGWSLVTNKNDGDIPAE